MKAEAVPLVSVVVPSYRHERFVDQALESVYEQDYPRLELIVVDDHSPDGTPERVRAFMSRAEVELRFERLLFIRHDHNMGAPHAINRGIGEASGTFINLLNSDDRFAARRISTLVDRSGATGAQFMFSGVTVAGAADAEQRAEGSFLMGLQDSLRRFPTVGFALLRNQVAISSGNFFFARDLFEQVGPFSNLAYCHDWDFIVRAVLLTEPEFVPDSLYVYRLHDSNSFQKLHDTAEAETESVLKTYFLNCRTRAVRNPLAPSPAWGPYFDAFVQASQYQRFLVKP